MFALSDLRIKSHQTPRFCWLLALVLVCASVFSMAHMASHGFANHDHHGQTCSVYTHCQQAKHSSVAHGFGFELPLAVAPLVAQTRVAQVLRDAPRFAQVRAPPTFS